MSTKRVVPKRGVMVGRDRVHFSIGVQTFTLENLGPIDGVDDEEHLGRFVAPNLEHALRALAGTEPHPVEQLANNYLARGREYRDDDGLPDDWQPTQEVP